MFKTIKDYPFVEISSNCEVRRVGKTTILKPYISKGYLRYNIKYQGKTYHLMQHRLMAQAYIDNPEGKDQVNHIDGNKLNNSTTNLEWCTASENQVHARDTGLNPVLYGEDTSSAVLTEVDVRNVCKMIEQGMRNCDVEKVSNATRSQIKDIRTGKAWLTVSKDYNLQIVRRGRVSESTVRWICESLQEGSTVSQIVSRATSDMVTESRVRHIKNRNAYKDISTDYNF